MLRSVSLMGDVTLFVCGSEMPNRMIASNDKDGGCFVETNYEMSSLW